MTAKTILCYRVVFCSAGGLNRAAAGVIVWLCIARVYNIFRSGRGRMLEMNKSKCGLSRIYEMNCELTPVGLFNGKNKTN